MKNIFFISLLICVGKLFSQDTIKTQAIELANNDTIGYYIAPHFGLSFISEQSGEPDIAKIWGVKTGIILRKNFSAGIIINLITSSSIETINYWGINETHIYNWIEYTKIKSGGFFVDFIVSNYDSPIRVSFPVDLQIGQFTQKPSTTPNDTITFHTPLPVTQKSSVFYILEPSINFDFNFNKYIVPSINVGFRAASTNKLNLNYPFANLTVKFGRF
jgi:hypothetical protein